MRYAVVITHKVENGRVIVNKFWTLAAAQEFANDSANDEWETFVLDTEATTPSNRINLKGKK